MILIYTNEFPTATGGVGSFTLHIVDYLNRNKLKLTVLTQHFSMRDRVFDEKQAYKIIRIPKVKNVFIAYILGTLWFLSVIIKTRPKKILVADILSQRVVSFLLPFLKKRDISIVAYGSEIMANYNERGIKKLIFTSLYKRARIIIAISRYTKELLIKRNVAADKIVIINPGLDYKWFNGKVHHLKLKEEGGFRSASIILTVARLSQRKGHDIVISAMPKLLEEFPDLKYIIAGDGEEAARLKELVCNKNLDKQIIFAGSVGNDDLIAYYDACDIFVMPSREIGNLTEGFGISFIEAGARGKPVIGTKVGGIEDAVIDGVTGYLVQPDNTGEFVEKLSYLLKNKDVAKKLGEQAREYAQNKFYQGNQRDNLFKQAFRD